MNIENIYKNLTGVDIDQQKQLWDERGKGYYGEYLVFEELYSRIIGNSKILMNVEIPGLKTEKTEIDLILFHETGVYVFEIKHYKGTIYGKSDEQKWTQYFKTTKNEYFYNPVLQNRGHIDALKEFFPETPIMSFVVFTNPDVELKVTNNNKDVGICTLAELVPLFSDIIKDKKEIYTMDRLDTMFTELLQYSPIMNQNISIDGKSEPFYKYTDYIHRSYDKKVSELEKKSKQDQKKYRRLSLSVTTAVIIVSIAVIFGAWKYFDGNVKKAEEETANALAQYEDMRRNFSKATQLDSEEYNLNKDFLTVSNVEISYDYEIEYSTILNGMISVKGGDLGVCFPRNAQFVIQLKDGTIKYQGLWDCGNNTWLLQNYTYYSLSAEFSPSYYKTRFINIVPEDISYIKITNIELCQYPHGKVLRNDLEIEVYSAD